MTNNYDAEKYALRTFLERRGIVITKKNPPTLRCPNPAHIDEKPSAIFYTKGKTSPYPKVHCPVCAETWGVFEVAGLLDGVTEFKDKLKSVRDTLGISEPLLEKISQSKNFEPFPANKKNEINKQIEKIAFEKDWGKNAGSWKYRNEKRDIIALDVRFESEGQRKNIITFWYDGSLKHWGAPVFISGLDLIRKNPVAALIIHEGGKCAHMGNRKLTDFIHIFWSGGSGKAHLADWSILKNREVFIFPDDDPPGLKAAKKIKEQLPQAKILKPIIASRKIKPKGADIEEALQILTADELTKYILNPDNIELSDTGPSNPPKNSQLDRPPPHQVDGLVSDSSIPFKILGIGDDGRSAFISEEGRLLKYTLDSIGKQKLTVIANDSFWNTEYNYGKGKTDWDGATNDIVRASQRLDFIESNIRGRGAWRDGDKISYHDGVKTIGEWDDKKIYLRLPRHENGITDVPALPEMATQIKNAVFKMSFETPADAVRCLAWSVLAPFAGALIYRPALLLTGASGSGKTTVANLCIRKLADCEWFNGSESTVAGIRGKIKYDSRGVMFEEAERDTLKKATNRDELFSLMRVNVSNDAPDTVKGTKDGGYNSFKMQNMFGFIAIDPTVNSIADENRIFRVNMINPKNGNTWKKIEKELLESLSEKNCRAIRALTWKKLKTILNLSDKIVDAIRKKTGRDYRSSYADAMLASAFMVVWTGTDNPTDIQIENMLDKYYSFQMQDEHRDEAEEIIDRICDQLIEILHDHNREKISIIECLNRIYFGYRYDGEEQIFFSESDISTYKQHISRYGIRILDDGNIAIANSHHQIRQIINRGDGYNKIFKRHKGFVSGRKNIYFYDGKTRRCTVLKDVIEKKYDDKSDDEKLEALFV